MCTPSDSSAPETTSGPYDDPIARFYERHPYPPPVAELPAPSTDSDTRLRAEHHLLWPARPYPMDEPMAPRVLVAGCGTSQAARYALRHPGSEVTAIDVSDTSIRHTEALAQRYRLANLQVMRLPIEDATDLGQTFDHILCTGVLHHLADPTRGLAALADVLAPGGALHLMVYAKYGRVGIDMIREYGQLLGITASEADIDELAGSLEGLPAGHPLTHLLRSSPDFRDPHALADALLNPRETAYSVPELLRLLGSAGLGFGRWLRQAPYLPQCGALAGVAHGRRIERLDPASQYAVVELFRGTITRHSVIAYNADDLPAAQPITFDDDTDWLAFVPLRSPTSLAVDEPERLPPGAAAALLNRAHNHADLVLFVDDGARAMFDAIDGRASIGDIVGDFDPEPDALGFFEQLWRHDLAVFDGSASTGSPG